MKDDSTDSPEQADSTIYTQQDAGIMTELSQLRAEVEFLKQQISFNKNTASHEYEDDTGHMPMVFPENGASIEDYPFKVSATIRTINGDDIVLFTVKQGKWTHLKANDVGKMDRVTISSSVDEGAEFLTLQETTPGSYYVHVILDAGTSNDVRVNPSSSDVLNISYSIDAVPEMAGGTSVYKVLGFWNGVKWDQWWTGGNIEVDTVIPDNMGNGGLLLRSTLGYRPDIADGCEGTLQIYGAELAKADSKSIPVLTLDADGAGQVDFHSLDGHAATQTTRTLEAVDGTDGEKEVQINGANNAEDNAYDIPYLDTKAHETDNNHPIKWAALDSSVTSPETKTLELTGADPNKRQGLYGALSAEDNALCMAYLNTVSADRPLSWAAIDSHAASPVTRSLEILSGRVQVYGLGDGSDVGALAEGDLVIMRRVVDSIPTTVFASHAVFKGDDGEPGPKGDKGDNGSDDYYDGMWDSTDWAAFWADWGATIDAKYWHKGDGIDQNYGSAIGSDASTLAIDLSGHKLSNGTITTLEFGAIGAAVADVTYGVTLYPTPNADALDSGYPPPLGTNLYQLQQAVIELQTQLNAALAELRARKIINT